MSNLTSEPPYYISVYNQFVARMENVSLSLEWLVELFLHFDDVSDKQRFFSLSLERILELDHLRNDIVNSVRGASISEGEEVCRKLISKYIDPIKKYQDFLMENLHHFPESGKLKKIVRMNYSDALTPEIIEKSKRKEYNITIQDIDIKYNSFATSVLPTLYQIKKEIGDGRKNEKRGGVKVDKFSDLFDDKNVYKKILAILAENDPPFIDPVSLVWVDRKDGFRGQIIKVLKDLNRKGYYSKKIKVTNEIYQLVSLNTFGVKISISYLNRFNENSIHEKEFSFIPYAMDL